jgi:hypothetical protein
MRGGTASRHQTGLSLQKWELQGDFDKMQGGGGPSAAKSTQISMALDGLSDSPYCRSREAMVS